MSEKQESTQLMLAQLKNVLLLGECCSEYVKCILKKNFDLNSRISFTPYVALKDPDLIDCTALRLAFILNNVEGFKILLNNGADYEIANKNGSTLLHEITENFWEKNSLLRMDSPYANLMLSAHVKSNNYSNPCSANGISHFHAACLSANIGAVEAFLKNIISVDQCVSQNSSYFPGYTALHFAVRAHSFEVVKLLLNHGANINLKNAAGMTPLFMIIEQKIKILNAKQVDAMVSSDLMTDVLEEHEKIVQLLSQDKNVDSDNLSCFHVACTMKDSTVVKQLLQENDIDINQAINKNSPLWQGYTGLHLAALCNIDTVILLLNNGAAIKAMNAKGTTPFDLCLEKYHVKDIHKILSSIKSWKNITLSDARTRLLDLIFAMQSWKQLDTFLKSSAVHKQAFVPTQSPLWPGFTILHLAVLLCSLDRKIIAVCLRFGVNVVAKDVRGWTALHLAYRRGKKDVVEFLTHIYELNNRMLNSVDEDNLSYLHFACEEGKVILVEELLTASNIGDNVGLAYTGEHLGSSMRRGFTPLHVAIVSGSSEIADKLMKNGADLYATDFDGLTPIHWILSRAEPRPFDDIRLSECNRHIVERLVNGLSHLHIASYVGDKLSVERLLRDNANVNLTIDYESDKSPPFLARYSGYTPLHLALRMNNTKVVFVLVKAGADIFAENPYDSSTPFFDALDGKYEDQLVHFAGVFRRNKRMIRQLEKTIGLTLLHVACRERDVSLVIQQLALKAKVNRRIHLDSPIWPGCTPLHVLMMKCEKIEWQNTSTVRQIVDLLLDYELDVNVANSEGNTVLHLAHDSLKNLLLNNVRNYNLNPENYRGLSHFDIACSMNNVAAVRKFMKRNIDVNRQIDYFSDWNPGCSPLHLAVSSEHFDRSIVDVLLENGARVDAEDAAGRTVLHLAASFGYVDFNLMENIIDAGINIDATDIYGKTALETLLLTRNFPVEKLKFFMNRKCSLNAFNSITENGYLPMILDSNNSNNFMIIMFEAVLNDLLNDELERTVIHNIVSTSVQKLSSDEYTKFIQNMTKLAACGVDDQDKKGRTALHLAAKFANSEAVAGLLKNGGDIDIDDFNGKSAFSYSMEYFLQCSPDSPDKQLHENVLKVFVEHTRLLNFLNLYVSSSNKYCGDKLSNLENQSGLEIEKMYSHELQISKTVKIGSCSWTVNDLLSEIGLVVAYPFMTLSERNIIDQFIISCNYEIFPNLEGIVKLQYQKALNRNELVEFATIAFVKLTGISFSRSCCENIFRFLANAELKNLIISPTMNMP